MVSFYRAGSLIFFGTGKLIYINLLNTHARLRETGGTLNRAVVAALHVFAQGEFDEAISAFKFHFVGQYAPAVLDQLCLPADGVGRAVKNMRCGDTPSQLPVKLDILGVEHIRY